MSLTGKPPCHFAQSGSNWRVLVHPEFAAETSAHVFANDTHLFRWQLNLAGKAVSDGEEHLRAVKSENTVGRFPSDDATVRF
jgi:hypothetical protein